MRLERRKKIIACFLLVVFVTDLLLPVSAHALTNGPAQPEMQKFEPAGASNMVDLFTGDFKYNIPLLDVEGYPLNLSYQSGTGMEEEASWVGLGWTLNPGAVNRDLRGLPDDFNGDEIIKDHKQKEFKKVGGQIVLKPSILAWEIGKPSLKIGVYKDNYYGIGAELGASLGFQLARNKKTTLTAGLDFNLDSREGASITPSLSLSRAHDTWREESARSISGSLEYNTRSGLKQTALNASFSTSKKGLYISTLELSAVKYFGQTYTPSFNTNTTNTGYTFSFDIGPTIFGGYIGVGGAGYLYKEKIDRVRTKAPAYGYMNYLNGRKKTNALLDFNREKDGVYVPGSPAIPIPVGTQDFFVATGQMGSQQFRPFFSGNYVVFDKLHSNTTVNAKLGLTIGVGNLHKSGARLDLTGGDATTSKWTNNNDYLSRAEPAFSVAAKPDEEGVYLRSTGEYTRSDIDFMNTIRNDETVQVAINDKHNLFPTAKTYTAFKSREAGRQAITADLKRLKRDIRTTAISYLNATQARKYGLDKTINGADIRQSGYRKSHHISEITITDIEGKRMVYGIPVYNTEQRDVNFSCGTPLPAQLDQVRRSGLIGYIPGFDNGIFNFRGRDQLFSRTIMPAYPSSFLLTGVLSPDYVDLKNDGITDDDLGTAFKFNYTQVAGEYQWRAPYAVNTANYHEGFLSDPKDDKASYTYGKKEIWYLSSVEGKTTVAHFFTSDRHDGLGVLGENGGQNSSMRLKKLDSIKLYSKADLINNPASATPIKSVYFEYDYSLQPEVPNNTGMAINKYGAGVAPTSPDNVNKDKGKLTLKKVYFTFGANARGRLHPYEFEYDTRLIQDVFPQLPVPFNDPQHPESKNTYAPRQSDRWGTYKPSWYNDLTGNLNNSEFPYTIQENGNVAQGFVERDFANTVAAKWQLNKLTTPAGSIINIQYEADDYGYVQNRRAMQMCRVVGVGNTAGASTGLNTAPGLVVELPVPATSIDDFRRKYLLQADGQYLKNILYKTFTNLGNPGYKDYVQGYAEINLNSCAIMDNGNKAFIALRPVNAYNPISKAAWQMVKTDLPQFVYDNYDNSDADSFGDDVVAAVRSLVQAFVNRREFFQSFDKTADGRDIADAVDLSKSMIRLCNPGFNKIGGGSRVRKLTISDEWQEMTAQSGKTAMFGQLYEYSTKDAAGNPISSGVAAYEPSIGNEENPFHEPINFTQKVHWAPNKYHFVEKPFCETFFPAASVGYSKVTVTDFGDTYAREGTLVKHTGYTENEYYTARDFPTLVDNMTLEAYERENNMLLKLFTSTYKKQVATSQGFKVEVNDMHGKVKAIKAFNNNGELITATENFYSVVNDNDEEKRLHNKMPVLEANGTITDNVLLATDVDFVTDVRASINESIGTSIGGYKGGLFTGIPFFPYFPYGAVNFGASFTKTAYNSISAVKVIHRYGILKKIRKESNGSSIVSENLLWNGETGDVLLTRTQNEFNDYTYSFNYPAYLAKDHEGMSSAYKNAGAVFTSFSTPANGVISSQYSSYVFPGDELVSISGDGKGWVMRSGDNSLRLIDANGEFMTTSGMYMVLRSGRRNMSGASAGSIVCMNNPIVEVNGSKRLQLGVDRKILDAKAVLYKDEWSIPVPDQYRAVQQIDDQYCPQDCLLDLLFGSIIKVLETGSSGTRRGFFSLLADNQNVKHLMEKYREREPYCDIWGNQSSATSLYYHNSLHTVNVGGVTRYEVQPGDVIQMGVFQMVVDWVSPQFNDLVNSNMTEAQMAALIDDIISPSIPLSKYCFTTIDYIDPNNPITGWCQKQLVFREFKEPCNNNITITPCSPIACAYTDLLKVHLIGPPEYNILVNKCLDPLTVPINPYVTGVLGNWRAERNFVYTVPRVQKAGLTTQNGGTNIRTSGHYASFNPFWNFQPLGGIQSSVQPDPIIPAERWVWNQRSIYYDQKSNEVENTDALNRSNAALFGYRESFATAVSSNARRNEIAFDGFEDYNFALQNNLQENCPLKRHFDWGLTKQGGIWTSAAGTITSQKAHTGNYSYALTGMASVSKTAGNATPPTQILDYDANGRYKLLANELVKGFAPINGKKYLLSMWVYETEEVPTNTIKKLGITINGQSFPVNTITVPVVERWKRIEIPFTAGETFGLSLIPNGTVWIDDVRLLPAAGQLSSFVYDDKTLRLLAQLDENNFATIYEYDEEGTPVRIKKETDRGIMTLKENRKAFRKRE